MRRLVRLVRGVPGMVEWARVEGYADAVRDVAAELRPAIVQLETHAMAQYLPALSASSARIVLVEHDPGMNAARDAARAGSAPDRLSQRLEALAWRRFARRTFARLDAAVAFTDRDRRATEAQAPGLLVVRIPFGTELRDHPLDPVGSEPATLLLVGGYQHPPNADAARRVMGPIFDCVSARRPDVVLDVVGSKPTPEMQRLVRDRVRLLGHVPSVEPYLDQAAVVVVPLRLGGGMRVKVLETLAAGKALVASNRAVDGLDVTAGREFALAESDEDFCEAVVALLDDPARRRALGSAARAWAEENLGWDAIVAAYERLYASLPGPAGADA
jgi:glycosyltransferase involved in cell wall biosynthesis